jgi:hypothetical protein
MTRKREHVTRMSSGHLGFTPPKPGGVVCLTVRSDDREEATARLAEAPFNDEFVGAASSRPTA